MIIAKDFSVWDNSVYLADVLEGLALLPRSPDPHGLPACSTPPENAAPCTPGQPQRAP